MMPRAMEEFSNFTSVGRIDAVPVEVNKTGRNHQTFGVNGVSAFEDCGGDRPYFSADDTDAPNGRRAWIPDRLPARSQ